MGYDAERLGRIEAAFARMSVECVAHEAPPCGRRPLRQPGEEVGYIEMRIRHGRRTMKLCIGGVLPRPRLVAGRLRTVREAPRRVPGVGTWAGGSRPSARTARRCTTRSPGAEGASAIRLRRSKIMPLPLIEKLRK